MMKLFNLGGSSAAAAATSSSSTASPTEPEPATLLVIQMDNYDWPEIFKGYTLQDGRKIRVVQTGWDHIQVTVDTYSSASLRVEVQKLAPSASKDPALKSDRYFNIKPDFLLIRNEVKTPGFDGRPRLEGFMLADVPSVNSLESVYCFCSRPATMGFLQRLNKRLGNEAFPLIPQHFASSHRSFMYGYTFPAVVKVGSAHAGAGKMKITDHHQMSDFRSVLMMMPNEHCFAEPFIEGAHDLRIQKIGDHYRAYKRRDLSGEWKTNTGYGACIEEVDIEDRWKAWADAAADMFGGLDILTVDAIVQEGTEKEYILEVNGTSSGWAPENADADNEHLRDLVLDKMNQMLCA